ncbi:uncharacterized protein PAC_11772 [Phialocephala subalpina]|uniref:Uncharacterized protein n=1 Tax=Phialocephala subalpina TaxID=576137 RepID=A0A1L7XA18_9HELO|nr:uncharacterized protein PAC_11772 [Phialocephala subalpina]
MVSMVQRKPYIDVSRSPSEFESTSCDQDLPDENSSMTQSRRPVSPLSAINPLNNSRSNKGNLGSFSSSLENTRKISSVREGTPTLALGHHFYYKSLDGTIAGSARRQQWAITFGTTFAFLVVHLLAAATVIAHSQYIWSMVRRRGYTLETLDNLFTMTSDPRAFFNPEILKHGQIAVLLALISWCMGIASVTPPGTLSVVPGLQNQTILTPWPSLNWSLPGWITDETNLAPPPSIISVATDTAYEMSLLPISPPYLNSSYSIKFHGPSLQCKAANATQKPVFDYYSQQLFNKSTYNNETGVFITTPGIAESPEFNTTKNEMLVGDIKSSWWQALVFSAFAPNDGCPGWVTEPTTGKGGCPAIDQFNNWNVDLPADFADLISYQANMTANGDFADVDQNSLIFKEIARLSSFDNETFTSQQLWITTTSSEIVCVLGNASFELDFGYVSSIQSVSRNITDFRPLYMISEFGELNGIRRATAGLLWPELPAYGSIFTALVNVLSGNITLAMSTMWGADATILEVESQTSRAMLTGLIACEDMTPNFWFDIENMDRYFAPNNNISGHAHTDIFEQPSWMCRNGTLAPAIEDLFNNITISMLSANISGAPNQTIPITTFSTHNIYQYNSLNLILSYGVAIAVAILSIAIGTYVTIQNGVSHSTSFSATIATTRNVQLDRLVEGSSLGALPLDRDVRKTKVRFRELVDGDGDIAFGLEDRVLGLRRGEKYT